MRWATAIWAGAVALALAGGSAVLAQDKAKEQTQSQARERIYGYQLMTEQERNEYRQQMRAATTADERERMRAEHHERMKERAKERGITLPDEPPMRGQGRGPGAGAGGGPGKK